MCDAYRGAYFSSKNVFKQAKLFKEGQKSIQCEDWPGRPTISSTPEMVDLVYVLILLTKELQ